MIGCREKRMPQADTETLSVTDENLADFLGGIETTQGGIDRFQRLNKTKWSNDFKSRLAQIILGITALVSVNYWGVDMPKASWIGGDDLPIEQSVEDVRRDDLSAKGMPPNDKTPIIDLELQKK